MVQITGVLWYAALLALPCFGVAATVKHGTNSHAAKFGSNDEHAPPQHRDHLPDLNSPRSSFLHVHRQTPMIALQASQSTHLQSSILKARHKSKSASMAMQRSESWLKHLRTLQRRNMKGLKAMVKNQKKNKSQKQGGKEKLGICKGSKLKWWIKATKKCKKAFGGESRWDKDKMDGRCKEKWDECVTGYYSVCCSQPQGPKTMDAYCAGKSLTVYKATDKADPDKACSIQQSMRDMQGIMQGIKGAVVMLDTKLQLAPMQFAPGPAPAPMPMSAAPPGILAVAPAPAPVPSSPAIIAGVDRCAVLMELTRQASEKVKAIKQWAEQDGIKDVRLGKKKSKKTSFFQKHDEEADDDDDEKVGSTDIAKKFMGKESKISDTEAKDPDMAFAVKGVIHAGKKLDAILKTSKLCGSGVDDDSDADDEEDDDNDGAEDDIEEEDEEPAYNETALQGLLDWELDMAEAVDKFEKDVHPHGFKWWRYRYEYTLIESLVLAFSVMLLYFVMWLLHGASFFAISKFYKTGIPDKLNRYAWAYFVFHAASLMIMVTVAYMMYIPWGEANIFDVGAAYLHDAVDGRVNVPFLGYSWLYMILDVQFQLFVCFSLYSLFVVFVAHSFTTALKDFKMMSDNQEDRCISLRNVAFYKHLESIMTRRVQNTAEYRNIFHKLQLKMIGVQGLDKDVAGWNQFRLHLYLTDSLGRSVEYLVQISLTTNIFLSCSALLVALLANYYQVAFMYFLPGFLVVGLVLFTIGYLTARHFRKLADDDTHNAEAKWVNIHSYCRCIQICLYCIFFSFSRLLLSNDIFTFYPKVYVSALLGLILLLMLLFFFAGEALKETACALVLPPHLPVEKFKAKLNHIVLWHTTDHCHEFGVQQSTTCSPSRQWAGCTGSLDGKQEPTDTYRPSSFR